MLTRLQEFKLLQQALIRRNQHGATGGIDDQFVLVSDRIDHPMQADNRRNPKAAGQNSGVGDRPAQAGDESGHTSMAQHHRICGAEVPSDDDSIGELRLHAGQVWVSFCPLSEDVHNPSHDLSHIIFFGAQIGIGDVVEEGRQRLGMVAEGPFGVNLLAPDRFCRLL